MGMMACYLEAEHELIDRLMQLSDEDLFEECESLLEDNLLSEAIVGTSMFSDDEESDFIAYIYPDRLKEILAKLDKFDISNALNGFSPRVLARNCIFR